MTDTTLKSKYSSIDEQNLLALHHWQPKGRTPLFKQEDVFKGEKLTK